MPFKDPEARRKYQREWLAKRRDAWLAGKSCVQCGSTDDLEIDHVEPLTKDELLQGKFGTSRMWSWAPARLERELAKTQVLCHDCHAAKTKLERAVHECRANHRYVDGSYYLAHGVKQCRQCHRESMARTRARKRALATGGN